MTDQEKLKLIRKFIPGTVEDIAMEVPCHVQTIYNIQAGKDVKHKAILNGFNALYEKALKIQVIAES